VVEKILVFVDPTKGHDGSVEVSPIGSFQLIVLQNCEENTGKENDLL